MGVANRSTRMARTWRRARLVQALRVSFREACSHVRLSNVVIPWESASVAHPSWALGFALKWPIQTCQYGLNFKPKLQLSDHVILKFDGVFFCHKTPCAKNQRGIRST